MIETNSVLLTPAGSETKRVIYMTVKHTVLTGPAHSRCQSAQINLYFRDFCQFRPLTTPEVSLCRTPPEKHTILTLC